MLEQLPLFSSVSDKKSVSLTQNVSEHKRQAIQRFLDSGKKENDVCVGKYSPGKRKSEYFRLSYRLGRKVKHVHIPGGSTQTSLARYRAKILREMCDRGAELAEILAQLNTFRSGGK